MVYFSDNAHLSWVRDSAMWLDECLQRKCCHQIRPSITASGCPGTRLANSAALPRCSRIPSLPQRCPVACPSSCPVCWARAAPSFFTSLSAAVRRMERRIIVFQQVSSSSSPVDRARALAIFFTSRTARSSQLNVVFIVLQSTKIHLISGLKYVNVVSLIWIRNSQEHFSRKYLTFDSPSHILQTNPCPTYMGATMS